MLDLSIDEINYLLVELFDDAEHCDITTDKVSLVLAENEIPHERMIGKTYCQTRHVTIFPHCWISLNNGIVIDFLLSKFLGDETDIPSGAFLPPDTIQYSGDKTALPNRY